MDVSRIRGDEVLKRCMLKRIKNPLTHETSFQNTVAKLLLF